MENECLVHRKGHDGHFKAKTFPKTFTKTFPKTFPLSSGSLYAAVATPGGRRV